MLQKLVGVETFTGARKEKVDSQPAQERFYSQVVDQRGGAATTRVFPAPAEVPMADLFGRQIDSSNPHEVALFEGEKARRLGKRFDTQDEHVRHSLSQLITPKVGKATLDMAIDTMFALDPTVLDVIRTIHAQNIFACQDGFDPKEMERAAGRFFIGAEFQNPTRRSVDANLQEPPKLRMTIWSPKSVAQGVKQRVLDPVARALQTLKLRRKITDLEEAIKVASANGEEEKLAKTRAELTESQNKLSAVERDRSRKHILTTLTESLFTTQEISMAVAMDVDQRRTTPSGQIIIGDPKGVPFEDQFFNAYRFTFEFPLRKKEFQVYLNEYVIGSNGKPRLKDTVLHHVEQLRTDELKQVASTFCQQEYPEMSELERNRVAAEIEQHARTEPHKVHFSRPLSPEALQVFAVVERYLQFNTIRPQTAFKTPAAWEAEFSK